MNLTDAYTTFMLNQNILVQVLLTIIVATIPAYIIAQYLLEPLMVFFFGQAHINEVMNAHAGSEERLC